MTAMGKITASSGKEKKKIVPNRYIHQNVLWTLSFDFNPLTPKIWLLILPSSCYTFPCELVTQIWC